MSAWARCLRALSLALLTALCPPLFAEPQPARDEPAAPPEPPAPAEPSASSARSDGDARSEAEPSRYDSLSDLEERMVQQALLDLELRPIDDASITGPICALHVQRYRIVREVDRLPLWLNRFHTLTREQVVVRGIVLGVGDTYTERGRRESERQIRDPLLFGVSVVVPVQGDPGCVDVLVVTRDAWSLTFNVSPESNGRTLTGLYVGVTEANLAGTNTLASVSYDMDPASWSFGPFVSARRLGSTRWSLSQSVRVHGDREAGRGVDGTSSSFRLERPLYATHVEWGGYVSFDHSVTVARSLAGNQVRAYATDVQATDGEGNLLYVDADGQITDDPGAQGENAGLAETVDERWRRRRFAGEVGVTRSWGTTWKHNLTPRFFAADSRARALPFAEVSPEALADFEANVLPRSERTIGPAIRWSAFENRHVYLRNYATYGFSEEVRRGPSSTLGLAWVEPALGSTDRFLSLSWSALMRAVYDDGFFAFSFAPAMRLDEDWSDLRLQGAARLVLPSWFWGRILVRVSASTVLRNEANSRVAIGGRFSVRGYADGFAVGDRVLRTNLEWRSRPLDLFLWRFGFVAFADGAATWFEGAAVDYYPSVGFGLRLVIPQLGTRIRAADLSFPLRDSAGGGRAGVPLFSFGLDQSF